jgi:hypothetical protein
LREITCIYDTILEPDAPNKPDALIRYDPKQIIVDKCVATHHYKTYIHLRRPSALSATLGGSLRRTLPLTIALAFAPALRWRLVRALQVGPKQHQCVIALDCACVLDVWHCDLHPLDRARQVLYEHIAIGLILRHLDVPELHSERLDCLFHMVSEVLLVASILVTRWQYLLLLQAHLLAYDTTCKRTCMHHVRHLFASSLCDLCV